MITGIKERGKAEVSDKTILDSLVPGLESLKQSIENGDDLKLSAEKAFLSAEEGMKKTIQMKSLKGRAARYLSMNQ